MQVNIEQVLKDYGPLFSRLAGSYESNLALRQELTQEIALHVWQSLKQFRGESQLKTYVLKIAHNRCVQHVMSESKRSSVISEEGEIPAETPVGDNAENQVMLDTLLAEIRLLPIKQRQVITLHLEGLQYNEIADICGVSGSNVGVMINRIRKHLSEVLKHE